MQDFIPNSTIGVPIDVVLFDNAGAPRPGESSSTNVYILCLDNGYVLDSADDTFRAAPASPMFGMTAYPSPSDNRYFHRFTSNIFPRGNFVAVISAAGDEIYTEEFSVGLRAPRTLGISAAYSGTSLTISAWVEEGGEIQTDYTALNSCQILNASGTQITGGNLGNMTNPNSGIFTLTSSITLGANTNYVFSCNAVVPAAANVANLQFPLRVGIAKP